MDRLHGDVVDQRASTLVVLPEILRELDVGPRAVFEGTGINPDTLTAETRVPFEALATLLEKAVAKTGRVDLGLMLGERFVFAHHGIVGELMQTAPTLGAAFRAFTRWQPGYSSGAVVYLHSEGDMTAVGSAVCSASVRPGRVYTDLVLAIGARMVALMTGGAVGLSEVYVTHRRPADTTAYARVFGAPVRFGESLSCMYLPTEALSVPLPGRDAARHAAILVQIEDVLRGKAPPLETLVRGALRKLILVGKPTMRGVAAELAMHPRTMRRRLKSEGCVFEDLRDEVRVSAALELLELGDLSVADVAAALSYASPEAFAGAFRRVQGMSPREWRANYARHA